MDKKRRKLFSGVRESLGGVNKAWISAKIISDKNADGFDQNYIEVSYSLRDMGPPMRIDIPYELAVAGGEKLLEAITHANKRFVDDMAALWDTIVRYHYAKTGEQPGQAIDLAQRRISLRLYENVANRICHSYFTKLKATLGMPTLEPCLSLLDANTGNESSNFIHHIHEAIKGGAYSKVYRDDTLENELKNYRGKIKDSFDIVKEWCIDEQIRFNKHPAKVGAALIKVSTVLDAAMGEYETAWLQSAMEIRRQGYIAKQDAQELQDCVQSSIAFAKDIFAQFKRNPEYFPTSNEEGSYADPLKEEGLGALDQWLDKMHGEAEKLGDPLAVRDKISGVASKPAPRARWSR